MADPKIAQLQKEIDNLRASILGADTKSKHFLHTMGKIGVKQSEIRERLRETGRAVEQVGKNASRSGDALEKATTTLQRFSNIATNAGNAFGNLADAGYKGEGAFKSLKSSVVSAMGVIKESSALLEGLLPTDLLKKIPLVGPAFSKAFGVGTAVVGGATDIVKDMIKVFESVTAAVDRTTKTHRIYSNEMFNLGKRFGETIDDAEGFVSTMRKAVSSEFGESVYLSADALKAFASSAKNTNLSLSDLSETVSIGAEKTSLLAAATAQSNAIGLDQFTYIRQLNRMMKVQGMTAQESIETFGMYSEVAKETGLSVDSVSQGLMRAASGFEKLGMTAEFGRPILSGFTDSLESMGLGIESAVDLTSSLSRALNKVTQDYGLAYLTFQRGGLEIGGASANSGMLGTSIGLQAAMLDAEKTGDSSAIASQMVAGMRDTLASFTGGDIVTVKQAAEDPSLQNAFYVQQQMLGSQYGITGADATRTLEMLSQLDEAKASGDTDMVRKLEQQIQEQKKADDKTFDIQKKIDFSVARAAASLEEQTIMMKMRARGVFDRVAGGKVISAIGAARREAEGFLAEGNTGEYFKNLDQKLENKLDKLMKDEIEGRSAKRADAAANAARQAREAQLKTVKKEIQEQKPANDLKSSIDKLIETLNKPQSINIGFSENAKDFLKLVDQAKSRTGERR
mgnify:CR=1 FL=1